MSQTLELPDRIYEALTAAARDNGLTAAEWLALHLHVEEPDRERPLPELTAGLTGVIDSTETQSTHQTPFSTALAEKFRKQGLRIP
ncbi:MAG: hypothetical protein DMF76_25190 [Acidobacteria bacterium]|nr:MAG: hypothetical protein DMF76_25190 [Acidobacteriota bacterium]